MNSPESEAQEALERERREKEENIQRMLSSTYERKIKQESESEEEKEKMTLDEYVEKLTADLPVLLREEVQGHVDKFKKYNAPESDLKDETEGKRKEVLKRYEDNFGMYNKEYSRMLMSDKIEDIFDNEPKVEDLKKLARISWDLNGLKAVNDLNGGRHREGDVYIGVAVEVLSDKSIKALARKYGLRFDAVHDSGDEFAAVVTSEEPITHGSEAEKGLNDLIAVISDKINRHRSAQEALDLEDEDVLYNLYKIELRSRGLEPEPRSLELIEEFKKTIPKNYKFKAWMSGGVSTLYDSLMRYEGGKNDIQEEDDHDKVVKKLMGTLIDMSDEVMGKRKAEDKAMISREGKNGDEDAAMLDRIYNIREAGAFLKQANEKLKSDNEEVRKELRDTKETLQVYQVGFDDLQKAVEAGASKEQLEAMIEKMQS